MGGLGGYDGGVEAVGEGSDGSFAERVGRAWGVEGLFESSDAMRVGH